MEPMYSPVIPAEINCTELKRKMPITRGAAAAGTATGEMRVDPRA